MITSYRPPLTSSACVPLAPPSLPPPWLPSHRYTLSLQPPQDKVFASIAPHVVQHFASTWRLYPNTPPRNPPSRDTTSRNPRHTHDYFYLLPLYTFFGTSVYIRAALRSHPLGSTLLDNLLEWIGATAARLALLPWSSVSSPFPHLLDSAFNPDATPIYSTGGTSRPRIRYSRLRRCRSRSRPSSLDHPLSPPPTHPSSFISTLTRSRPESLPGSARPFLQRSRRGS